jgi:hypothetical protein
MAVDTPSSANVNEPQAELEADVGVVSTQNTEDALLADGTAENQQSAAENELEKQTIPTPTSQRTRAWTITTLYAQLLY